MDTTGGIKSKNMTEQPKEKASKWCQRMSEQAKSASEVKDYKRLAAVWTEREGKK